MNFNTCIKTILLGEICSGKSSFCNRLINDQFDTDYLSTIGIDYHTYNYKSYKIQLWDTAGQDRFNYLLPSFFRNINIVLIMLDLNNNESIDSLHKWYSTVLTCCKEPYSIIVVGNKIDLFIKVDRQKIYDFINNKNISYVEISVKNQINLNNLIEEIIKSYKKLNIVNDENTILINNNNYNNKYCCIIV